MEDRPAGDAQKELLDRGGLRLDHGSVRGARSFLALILAARLASAAEPSHRQRAERAETLGNMAEAAQQFDAAWNEERAPELLYRLAIARRKLRQYSAAKEALRGYLREAPQGALRDEVERQLVHLNVLIEAQQESPPAEAPRARSAGAAAKKKVSPPRATAPSAVPPSPVASKLPGTTPSAPTAAPSPLDVAVSPPGAASSPPGAASSPPGVASSPPGVASSPASASLATGTAATLAAPAPVSGTSGMSAVTPRTAAPAAALSPARSAAAPWLAGGAVVAGAAAGLLWWDGARVSRELDARFATGELAAADGPRYSRARRESIGGRVLAAAATGLAAAAVVLWF